MIVSSLEFAGDSGSLSNINSTQGEFRAQIAALTDMVKQIAGNAAVSAGNTAQADPLSAPFQLYVNPYTGSDQFEGGSYNDYGTTAADRLKRLEKQRLVCGYSPQRPFKTINRAVLEAVIITSKAWYAPTDIAATTDVVSIILSPGEHVLYNDPGQSSTTITSYGASRDASAADLIKFNPATVGGVLLPRGCSLCGPDLRKTVIRPNWVPAAADEASDYSNRRGMLKITGTGYFFGFTIKDKASLTSSHHLLDGFHFASEAELDDFYAKTFSAVGSGADLSSALTVARSTEYQIVGPIEQGQNPSSAWDTTASASPYIFNCSIRSDYGLGGAFMDGSKVEGLKSMVCANFTGVSLQKDMSCWEIYQSGSWVQPTYQEYIDADPDDVRMKPERLSRHISAINDSIIQEVSIFAIGQGIHHFTDLGGEVTITNSNSSFGGCAAYSKGYKNAAFPSDKNWAVSKIRVPLDLQEKTGNIRKIFLGTISAVTSSTITLTSALAVDSSSTSTPQLLLNDGYTLKSGTYIWAENPQGDPWHAPLAANAWDSSTATEIDITAAFANTAGESTIGIDGTTNLLLGKRVYIRRLVDTRTPDERRVSIVASNTASVRLPQRNFIIQTDPARSGGAISQEFTKTGPEIFAISNAGAGDELGVTTSAEFTLRRSAPNQAYASGEFYPAGAVVKHNNKHFISNKDIYASTSSPDTTVWLETFVHTEESYNSEDPITQEARQIVIDTDTDTDGASTTLGITWSTVWADYSYRSSTDYKGMHAFLVALGFTDAQAHAVLVPQSADDRLLDPASATDFPDAPSGGAATGLGNWAIEFRRPSTLRLYGHSWEWAGFLNYSKAVPAVQKDLGAQNAFTYYFTHDSGGRVVPQGSNENGFNITPRGLEDVETGSTLTVENIGSSSIDDVQQTNFAQLDVDVLNVGTINVGTALNFDFGDPIGASTTVKGVVELASTAELEAAAPAANDAQINTDPKIVTTRGLAYWKNQNRLVSSTSGTQYVYVDPVNGRNVTNVDSLLSDPPADANNSIQSLKAAANYANAAFGSTQVVEFRIGPGIYLETGEVTFKTIAHIRAWDFSAGNYLNDDKAGGEKPFMGQAADGKSWNQTRTYFTTETNHPTFLIKPVVNFSYRNPERAKFESKPFQLSFEQAAKIVGVVWWGPMQTIIQPASDIPDSFFTGRSTVSTWRNSAIGDADNALNYLIKAEMDDPITTASDLEVPLSDFCIKASSTLEITNIAFDAITPCDSRQGWTTNAPTVVQTNGSPIKARGIWLIGNVNISSGLSGAPTLNGQSSYQITGFSNSLFDGDQQAGFAYGVTLNFYGFRLDGQNLNDPDYNLTWNNIHLVNNVMAYSTTNDVSPEGAGWKSIGPAVQGLFGKPRFVGTTNERFWHEGGTTTDSKRQGFKGKFGNYGVNNNSAANNRSKGIAGIVDGFELKFCREHYFFRTAGSAGEPADSGYPAGSGDAGSDVNFDDLNVLVTPIKQGIDVTRPLTASRSINL